MRADDRGLAALAAALIDSDLIRRYSEYAIDAHEFTMAREGFDVLAEQWAAAILGERGVFWPTGKDEYRELIRQREAAAIAAERERIAAAIGRNLTDARIEDLMRQHAIPLRRRGISVNLQARGVAASVRAAALAIVEPNP